jgi:hypothetical protein
VLLAHIVKQVRGYDATEWEIFTREWQRGLDGYHEVKRLGGPGDHGRDVIGLCSPRGCEGTWDNYQCKNYVSRRSASRLMIVACTDTSSAETGSSQTTKRGSVASARAMATRCRSPPLSWCGKRFR